MYKHISRHMYNSVVIMPQPHTSNQVNQKRKANEDPKRTAKKSKTGGKYDKTDKSDTFRTKLGNSEKHNFHFFFGKNDPLSQHYPVKFEIDGKTFNCAEQYMMYGKAVTFKDKHYEELILKTSDPVQQKKYGRKVQNFDPKVWREESIAIVTRANEAKFSQNPELKKYLLDTHPRDLVEASPRDRLWGIGLGRNNPKAFDRSTWRGKNLLGDILTKVRNKLMEDDNGVS